MLCNRSFMAWRCCSGVMEGIRLRCSRWIWIGTLGFIIIDGRESAATWIGANTTSGSLLNDGGKEDERRRPLCGISGSSCIDGGMTS